jgi:hypothetical protein
VLSEAASLILPDNAAFSHQTAAELCDLPLPRSTAKQDENEEPPISRSPSSTTAIITARTSSSGAATERGTKVYDTLGGSS